MPRGLSEIRGDEVEIDLEEVIYPRLSAIVASRGDGHCMRVNDLERTLMRRLCQRLRSEYPAAQTYILGVAEEAASQPLFVSGTKLVEFRNPTPDGSLRPPLLVFVPAGERASAEDSFGVATFE